MANEQTAYVGDDIKVLVNVIGSAGTHVAAVIDTTTTRLNGLSAAPTVTTVATGIYEIVFSGVTPAPAEGDRYTCKVNGTIAGVAWTEYGIPVKIVADERGTDNADKTLFQFPSTAATANTVSSVVTVSPLIISAKKVFIYLRYSSTVDNTPDANSHREIALQPPTPVNTSTAPAEINLKTYFGSDNRYFISNEISSAEIDITSLGLEVLHGDWTIIIRDNQGMGYNQQVLGASIEFSPLPVTIGDATAASQTSISSAISSLNDFDPASDTVANVTLVGTTTTNSDMRGTDGANTVTPNTTAPDNASITAIKAKTDQFAFTVSNQVDANALTGGGGDDSATIYNYFTASSREDAFKASGFNTVAPDNASISAILADTNELQQNQGDWATATGFATVNPDNASIAGIKAVTDNLPNSGALSDLATASALTTVDTVVDAIKVVTDNLPDSGSLTSLATSSALSTVDSNVDAIKTKTDQFVFTVSNQVDANTLTGGISASGIRSAIGLSSANLDTQLSDIPTVSEFEARTLLASAYFDPATDTVANVTLVGTTTTNTDMRGTEGANTITPNTVAPDNSSITAIKAKTDQLTFTVSNQVDSNALTMSGGGDATLANQTSILGMLSGVSVAVSQSGLKVGEQVTLRQGMDYNNVDGTAVSWAGSTSDQWPDLTGSTVTFYAVQGSKTITKNLTVSSPTGIQSFYLEMSSSDLSSTNAPSGNYRYYVVAVLSNTRKTALIEDGSLRIDQPYGT